MLLIILHENSLDFEFLDAFAVHIWKIIVYPGLLLILDFSLNLGFPIVSICNPATYNLNLPLLS